MLDVAIAQDVEAVCRAVLFGLGQALLVGSVLAALTWLLVRVLQKRVSPALEMALWCIVLLRFVIPGGPGWSGSLANLCATVVPVPLHAASYVESLPAITLSNGLPTGDGDARIAAPAAAVRPGWATWAMATYAGLLAGLGALRTLSYRRFRAAYLALPDADAGTRRIVRDICDRIGRRRLPLVRISDDGRAPFVMGALNPLLVLSRRQLIRPDELETVIVHEVTHLRRGDMLVRCVQCIAGLLFFFWPVVAWVNRRIDRAREYACDEWALRRGRLSAGQYARCLLEAARGRRLARWTYAPACMAGHPSTIERRIDVILTLPNRAPRGVVGRIGAGVILVAWCGFGLAGAQEPGAGGKAKYEPTEAGMQRHAQVLFTHVKELPGGDVNGDGEVTKEECWAFVAAVILSQPDAVLEAYPWADQNHNKQIEPDEAFFFGRGDYDFQELHEKFAPDKKKAADIKDEQKLQKLKQKLMTAEFATWHEILDRRAQLIDSAKTLPTAEFVRQVFEHEMPKVLAASEFDQCVQGVKEVSKWKLEARKLRAQVGTASAADRQELAAKAAQLEADVAKLTGKLQAEISARLAALDTRDSADEAERYRGLLKKLESP